MTVFGINGSPRKDWNTATLLKKALEGAASQGADTKLVHLYDLSFKGCQSCFACKLIDGPHNGRCAVNDDLSPILGNITDNAEAIILGSPVYLGSMSGEMRSFLERLLFPFLVYTRPPSSVFPRRIKAGVIYTMGLNEKMSTAYGYGAMFDATDASLRMIFGHSEKFCCYDTHQFPDYSKIFIEFFDPADKVLRHRTVFPDDCRKAFEFGRNCTAED